MVKTRSHVRILPVFTFTLFSLFSNFLSAQINTDSLDNLIDKAKAIDKPVLYLKFAKELTGKNNLKAENYATKALNYYLRSENAIKEAESLEILAKIESQKKEFEESNVHYLKALKIYTMVKDNKNTATVMNCIGVNYLNLSDYNKAIIWYEKSLIISKDNLPEEFGRSMLYYGMALRKMGKPDEAYDKIKGSISYLEKAKESELLSKAYHFLGLISYEKSSYQQAIDYYTIADSIRRKTGDWYGSAVTSNNIGNVYWVWGKYDVAIAAYQDAIKMSEKIGYLEGVASCLNNIGLIQDNTNDYKSSIESHKQALQIREKIGDRSGVANSLNNIASVQSKAIDVEFKNKYGNNWQDFLYKKIGKQNVMNYFNEAITNYKKSLKICDSLKDVGSIANLNNNIGTIYSWAGDYFLAEEYYKKAVDFYSGQKNSTEAAKNKLALGIIYAKTFRYDYAKKYLEEALTFAKESNIKDLMQDALLELSKYYETRGNIAKSFALYKQYNDVKDTVLNAEKIKQLKRAETLFETEKKQQQIEILNKDTALQKTLIKQQFYFIIFFILVSILVGALVILFYRQSKQRKLTNIELENKNALISGQKKEITDSIQYASRLQQAILPPDEILAQFIPDHFIFFRPRDIVSGDFYYVAEKDEKIVVVTADCTGHGVPGALMSMIGTSILNEIINKHDTLNPDIILNEMRLHIIKSLHQSGRTGEQRDGMDLALYIIDKKENKLDFAGANNPLIIVRNGELIEMKPDKMPIGIYEKGLVPFKSSSMAVQKNDMLYTFSDGICDQFGGPDGKKFLSKRLKEVLLNIHACGLQEQKEKINRVFCEWKGNYDQVDDVLLIGVRV